jgi:hypothetical protein
MMEIKAAGDDHRCLRRIARKLLELAEGGDLGAIKELADRIDGKPTQMVQTDAITAQTVIVGEITDQQRIAALEQLIAQGRELGRSPAAPSPAVVPATAENKQRPAVS